MVMVVYDYDDGIGPDWDARFVEGVAMGIAHCHRISRMEQMGRFAFRFVVVAQDIGKLRLQFDDCTYRFVGLVEHINENRKDHRWDYRPDVHSY